jgi:bifunctional DNase/RNase
MNVWKVLYDSVLGSSVVLLQDETGDRVLPIWVGQSEALSIAVACEGIKMARPMTHDLIKKLIESAGLTVEWIRVTDIVDGTFYALIRLTTASKSIEIDSRPSDAIALALRVQAPIFVAEHVLANAVGSDLSSLKSLEELEDDFLENLPDEIFGKYKM